MISSLLDVRISGTHLISGDAAEVFVCRCSDASASTLPFMPPARRSIRLTHTACVPSRLGGAL